HALAWDEAGGQRLAAPSVDPLRGLAESVGGGWNFASAGVLRLLHERPFLGGSYLRAAGDFAGICVAGAGGEVCAARAGQPATLAGDRVDFRGCGICGGRGGSDVAWAS